MWFCGFEWSQARDTGGVGVRKVEGYICRRMLVDELSSQMLASSCARHLRLPVQSCVSPALS